MQLPAKTFYSVTYPCTSIYRTAVDTARLYCFYFLRRSELVVTYPLLVLMTWLLAYLMQCHMSLVEVALLPAAAVLLAYPIGIVLTTLLIHSMEAFKGPCTTTIGEAGVDDSYSFGFISWSQVKKIELIDGNLWFSAASRGIYIPKAAFIDLAEAEEAMRLSKELKSVADAKTGGNLAVGDANEFLLKSLHAQEEARWAEIEKRHNAQ